MEKGINTYNKKRNFTITKEPKGKKGKSDKKLSFVVQKHSARKEHYDLRLEYNGVLKSFAVPKGPSYNYHDKRLAIRVEDHPLKYRNFEGVIPKGQYGGGSVMIWDEGYWEPIHHYKVDFLHGPLKFQLYGKRLKGKWTLVNFKEDNWLLIKEKDDFKGYKSINSLNKSIRSNRTMTQIKNNENYNGLNEVLGVKITHPNKLITKKPKLTKNDIINYYLKVSERMLKYSANRIISTVRYPEGLEGESFFKKHFESTSKELGKIVLEDKNGEKSNYYYIKNPKGLIAEVQMNSYEFHIWGSKVKKLEEPDMIVFDLDPDEGMELDKIRTGVKDLKSILDELNLSSFLKTSGGKGYHVIVKISGYTWPKIRKIAKNIAKLMETKWPDKYTTNIRKVSRKEKIFVDWIRNTRSSTSVAPYSLRIRKKLAVSCPIKWSELDKISPDGIDIEEVFKRLKRKDPWEDFLK